MVGKTVGKYRIVDRLGRGGMGTVYKAVDETLDREVAIKVLNPDLGDSDLLKRFRAEAVTLARLNHPGIATLYELHRHEDDLLMVMEYVHGETFHDLSDRLGPIAPPQAAHLCMQVLDALAHAHRAGVVHRDLKPANLMITETGSVKVMDFGIARVLGTEHFTHGGYMMGTPAYMAPEQVMGHEIDARADLYAVGVVFYRLLSAQLPFDADTAIAMVQKQISAEPTPIRTFRPETPEWCSHVIARALAKAPAGRFQSAEEFRSALMLAVRPQALGELPTTATPTPPGLFIDPEITLPYELGSTLASEGPTTDLPHRDGKGSQDRAGAPAGTGGLERTTGTTVVLGRTHLLVMAALFLVLAAGVAVLAVAVLKRNSLANQLPILGTLPQSSAPAAEAGDAPSGESGMGSGSVEGGSAAVEQASAREVAATAGAGGAVPAQAANGPQAPPAPTPAGDVRGGGNDEVPPSKPAPAPPMEFDDVRVIVTGDGDKGREREVVLRLGTDRLSLLERDGGPAIASLPYTAVVAAHYSRSKQPKWTDAEGNEVESKVDLGRFGLFRGDRNWIILLTRAEPLIFRVPDSDLKTVLPAFTERTEITVQR